MSRDSTSCPARGPNHPRTARGGNRPALALYWRRNPIAAWTGETYRQVKREAVAVEPEPSARCRNSRLCARQPRASRLRDIEHRQVEIKRVAFACSSATAISARGNSRRISRRHGKGRRTELISVDGVRLLPGARPGHPEAQNAPEPAREAQNGVDSRSGILQTPKELVESPFPLRNQTRKETFCSWTPKPNSYPLSLGPENQIPIPDSR